MHALKKRTLNLPWKENPTFARKWSKNTYSRLPENRANKYSHLPEILAGRFIIRDHSITSDCPSHRPLQFYTPRWAAIATSISTAPASSAVVGGARIAVSWGSPLKRMGQGLSCGESQEHELFIAVQKGEMETLEAMADEDPSLLALKSVNKRLSALHVAAANGRFQVGFSWSFLINIIVSYSFFIKLLLIFT